VRVLTLISDDLRFFRFEERARFGGPRVSKDWAWGRGERGEIWD
jgi:hypothetical protein